MAGTFPESTQPELPDEYQPRDVPSPADDATQRADRVECLADVPAEQWARYERQAEEEGEPPDTEVDDEELV